MCCIFAVLFFISPRFALLFMWIFTGLVDRAFDSFIIPLLGIIFLPLTTIAYVLFYIPAEGLSFWGWLVVFIAFVIDISLFGSGGYSYKRSMKVKEENEKKEN